MKRKLGVLVLVALVALLAATPALAAGPGEGKGFQHKEGGPLGGRQARQAFALVGVITALDSNTITIQVYHSNRIVQSSIGQELTVHLTGSTRYRQWTADGCIPASFDAVQVGDTASIMGRVSDGAYVAERVTVDVPLLGALK